MDKEELESLLALCYDEIVFKIGDICIAKADKEWYLVSLTTGQVLVNNIVKYSAMKTGYVLLYGKTEYDYNNDCYSTKTFIYSVKQNKIWDVPCKAEVYKTRKLLVLIDESPKYMVDIAIFENKTGNLLDRVKILKPSSVYRQSKAKIKLNKHKILSVAVNSIKLYEQQLFGSSVYDSITIDVEYTLNWMGLKLKIDSAKGLCIDE